MTGIPFCESNGEDLLAALGGGPILIQAVSTTLARPPAQLPRLLIDALQAGGPRERLLTPILVLLGQLRDIICDGERTWGAVMSKVGHASTARLGHES